jgi:hypothetical protein
VRSPALIIAGVVGVSLVLGGIVTALYGFMVLSRRAQHADVEPPAAAPPPPPPAWPFRLVFRDEAGGGARQIVIAPWGDVVAVGGRGSRLLARDTGATLLTLETCVIWSPDAAVFVDDHRLILACQDEVQEISFPRGQARTLFAFPHRMSHTAVGGGRVVAGTDGSRTAGDNSVTVYSLDDFRVVDTFDARLRIEAVAISSDGGRVAVGTEGSEIAIRDVAAGTMGPPLVLKRNRHAALRFSPAGARLFTDLDVFRAGEIELATGARGPSFDMGAWITTIRYAGDAGVLATGATGLALYAGDGLVTHAPLDDGEALDISADGSFLCASERTSSRVTCFSRGPVPPSTFVPAPASPVDPPRRRRSPRR